MKPPLLERFRAWITASSLRMVLVPMGAIIALFTAYSLWQLQEPLTATVRTPSKTRAAAYLSSIVTGAETVPTQGVLQSLVGQLALTAGITDIVVLALPERVVLASGRPDEVGLPLARLRDGRITAAVNDYLSSPERGLALRPEDTEVFGLAAALLPWRSSGLRGMPGEAVVYLRMTFADELEDMRGGLLRMAMQRLIFALTGLAAAGFLVHRIVGRPAKRVRSTVEEFAAGNPQARVTGVEHAEFAEVARAVNLAFAAVAQAQDRLRVMTEAAPTGIFSLDSSGACLATNERWREMTGLKAEEALGQGWLRAVHPEDRGLAQSTLLGRSRSEGPIYHRLLRADGTTRWVIRSLTPLAAAGSSGQPGGFIGTLTDITELRTLQDRISRSEQQQRLLFESMPQGVIIYDGTGRVIDANPAAERFLGYTREELIRGEHRTDPSNGPFREDGTFIPVEERPSHVSLRERREVRDVMMGLIPRQGGRLGWYRTNAIPLFAGRGDEARVYFTLEDITGIRAAQEALRRSEARYQDLVETSPDLIFECDPEGRLTYVNRTWEQVTGAAPATLLGRGWWALEPVRAEGKPLAGEAAFQRLRKERAISGVELEWHGPAGARIDIVVNAKAVTGPRGEVTGFRGTAYDITQRKATLALLAESQERFASFFDQAVDAMVVSSEDGIILEVNPAACSLLGWSREEMVGRGREMIIDVSDPRAAIAVGERSRDGLFHGELFSRRRNGERFEVEVTSKFYRARDGRRQAGTIVRDISARKQAEAVRLRSQRLESIGTLAGGIAHDLNNGLAPILLGITLLRRHFPERGDLLNTLQSSASKAAAMVRQLLTFARGTEGERRPVGSTRLLREVTDLTRSTFPRSITLSVDAPDDLWLVRGDETQLHQVALNLCVNARDAMPAGGTLTITARNEVLAERESSSLGDIQPGPYVVWRFRDTGTGMPAGVLERIFDPFYTTKPPGEGTGLGLPTALGIVRSHGGFFRVESREGAGSCFQVFLPAADADAAPATVAAPAATPAEPWSGRGRRILVVDDEPAVREVAVAVLESLGFGAESAIDAREALLRLADPAFAPVAVLTDFQMPGLDGLGLAREIRRRRPGLPVIVASGRFEETAITGLRGLGVTELLPKPFEEARLVEALRRVLGEGASAVDSTTPMRLQPLTP